MTNGLVWLAIDALILERLGQEGCNDALIGTGQPGHLALEFCREAPCSEEAINSALADVRRAVPTARLLVPEHLRVAGEGIPPMLIR